MWLSSDTDLIYGVLALEKTWSLLRLVLYLVFGVTGIIHRPGLCCGWSLDTDLVFVMAGLEIMVISGLRYD